MDISASRKVAGEGALHFEWPHKYILDLIFQHAKAIFPLFRWFEGLVRRNRFLEVFLLYGAN